MISQNVPTERCAAFIFIVVTYKMFLRNIPEDVDDCTKRSAGTLGLLDVCFGYL